MNEPNVGAFIGRFQVHDLHPGHIELIQSVVSKYRKVIGLIGVSPLPCSPSNPLDFEARKKMIEKLFPSVILIPIYDHPSDEIWSQNVDAAIRGLIGPTQTVALHGSRDSFAEYYSGSFPVVEMEATPGSITGTMDRTEIGQYAGDSPEWRAGAIWASQQCYPTVYPTVDVASFRLAGGGYELLMGRKPGETFWRLPGGFADPSCEGGYEEDAKRELLEETGLSVNTLEYVGSFPINDWRYQKTPHCIKTTLFLTRVSNTEAAVAADDLAEIKWIDQSWLPPISGGIVAPFHRKLVERAFHKLTARNV